MTDMDINDFFNIEAVHQLLDAPGGILNVILYAATDFIKEQLEPDTDPVDLILSSYACGAMCGTALLYTLGVLNTDGEALVDQLYTELQSMSVDTDVKPEQMN